MRVADVEVRSAGTVSVSAMECSRASVRAGQDVTLTALRAGHVTVITPAAVRVHKLLLGNVSLQGEVSGAGRAGWPRRGCRVDVHLVRRVVMRWAVIP